ncbi:hypothetical protein BDY21DRAFT_367352 [Lineolata rhizophorae]|uniref:Uncharacterized protein n=1 Tax=Lineolata rhizophorae TaxID=578093 RepID=A0A6A6NN89_9PEZI|nr:hypothetical protein BDY21DRAFT_367352 [Lineolata rhizophorae]
MPYRRVNGNAIPMIPDYISPKLWAQHLPIRLGDAHCSVEELQKEYYECHDRLNSTWVPKMVGVFQYLEEMQEHVKSYVILLESQPDCRSSLSTPLRMPWLTTTTSSITSSVNYPPSNALCKSRNVFYTSNIPKTREMVKDIQKGNAAKNSELGELRTMVLQLQLELATKTNKESAENVPSKQESAKCRKMTKSLER